MVKEKSVVISSREGSISITNIIVIRYQGVFIMHFVITYVM